MRKLQLSWNTLVEQVRSILHDSSVILHIYFRSVVPYIGLVSKKLAPFCQHIVGVDISQAMVDVYNNKRNELERRNMEAVCAELKGEPGELGDEKFDVIVVRTARASLTNLSIPTGSVPRRTITSRPSMMSLGCWRIFSNQAEPCLW